MKWVAKICLIFLFAALGWEVYKANTSPHEMLLPTQIVVKNWIVIIFFLFLAVYFWCLQRFEKGFFFKEIWFFVVLIVISFAITFTEINYNEQYYFNFFNVQYCHIASLIGFVGLLIVGIYIYVIIYSYRDFKKTGMPDGIIADLIKFVEKEIRESKIV